MKNKTFLLYFGFFALMAAAIGVSAITLYSQSIRLDESQSIWASTKSIPFLLKFIAQDVHVPFYDIILHFWLQLFGIGIGYARTLSLLFFILTLPVLYKIGKEAGSRNIAILNVVLFSLSPFIVWYSNEARMYTLFTLVTSLNHLYFLRLYRSNGTTSRTAYAISTILGLYTHYFFVFLIATQMIFIMGKLSGIIKGPEDFNSAPQTTIFRRYLPFALIYTRQLVIAGIFFLPWFVYFLALGGASNNQPLIPPPTSFNIFQAFVNFLFGFQSQGIQALLISLWPLLILIIFFVFTRQKKIAVDTLEYFALATFLPIALVFLGSYFRPIFLSRYLILVTPTLFFLVSWLLLSYSKRISMIVSGGLIVLMFGLLIYQNTSQATPVKENYEGTTAFLNSRVKPTDIIAVSAPFTVYPIEYYYNGSARITTIPEWYRYNEGSIPPFTQGKLEAQIKKFTKQYQNIYLVLSYDQGYESTIKKYMDSHYQRLVRKEFSPGLEVREYKLRYDTPSK